MADYVTNTLDSLFGNIKIEFGNGGTNTLIDATLLDVNISLGYDYSFFDLDLSDTIKLKFKNESSFTQAILDLIVDETCIINISSANAFVGRIARPSVVRDIKNKTIEFNVSSFDFSNKSYVGGLGQPTFNNVLTDIFTQIGHTFTITSRGTNQYTLYSTKIVYINADDLIGSNFRVKISNGIIGTIPLLKEIAKTLMIDLVTSGNNLEITPKDRSGISTVSKNTFSSSEIVEEYYISDDYSDEYSLTIINNLTQQLDLSGTFNRYSDDIVISELNRINMYKSTTNLDTADWTLTNGLDMFGETFVSGTNGTRLRWASSGNSTENINMSLPSSKINTLSQNDTIEFNFQLSRFKNKLLDVYVYINGSTPSRAEINNDYAYSLTTGVNVTSQHIIDNDPASKSAVIEFRPNENYFSSFLGGSIGRITAMSLDTAPSPNELTVTIESLSSTIGNPKTQIYGVSGYDNDFTILSFPTVNSVILDVGTITTTPVFDADSYLINPQLAFDELSVRISDISIGVANNISVKSLGFGDTAGSSLFLTCGDTLSTDADFYQRILEKGVGTAVTTIKDKTDKYTKKLSYVTKTDSILPSTPEPNDVILDDSLSYKQSKHEINLRTGEIKIEMTEI